MGAGAHNPRYEVVFFDLYGTLIDIRTDEQSETAWQALYDCVCELGADYESVDEMRERFEKLEAREMVHQADRAIVRNGWDEFDILPVYRSLLMNRSEEAEKKLALPQALEITDRINVTVAPNEETDAAIEAFADYIKGQVLADSIEIGDNAGVETEFDDFKLNILVEKN